MGYNWTVVVKENDKIDCGEYIVSCGRCYYTQTFYPSRIKEEFNLYDPMENDNI